MQKSSILDSLTCPLKLAVLLVLLSTWSVTGSLSAGTVRPVAWWTFDGANDSSVTDRISGIEDRISGNFKYTQGVSGLSLKSDGFTTEIIRRADSVPPLKNAFTIEIWIALGAYPWNWCPVLSQRADSSAGYFFAIGPRGQLSLQLALNGQWLSCSSADFEIPLRTWTHLAATFDERSGLGIYVNGRLAGKLETRGSFLPAGNSDLYIGMNREKVKPSNIHRSSGTLPGWFSLDGLLDELKIYNIALRREELEQAYLDTKISSDPDIPARRMPSGPEGPGRFGAYYTRLKFYDGWDDLWPVDSDPDVIVRFKSTAARLVFWRGTRYSPAWVSENGLWMADQSVEAWNDKEGCFEHMQDPQCRYSHVRIIENSAARVVVHWRYAPVSAHNHLWNTDPKSGWSCWIDEYYYIYPDAKCIRKVSWKKGSLGYPRQFQESIPFTQPGQVIGDVIQKDYVTVGNFNGETQVFSYTENPVKKTVPQNLTMQLHNFKAQNKPFIIFEPGNEMHYLKDMKIGSKGMNVPGSCNHWPVGQQNCDGRSVQATDRPTSFLGFPISDPPIHEKDGRCWWNGLYGMTKKSMRDLTTTGRSWAYAPEFLISSGNYTVDGYDMSQRAYLITCMSKDNPQILKGEIKSSQDSPLAQACLYISKWGDRNCTIRINEKGAVRNKDYITDLIHKLEYTDLIIWIADESFDPLTIEIIPEN